MPKLAQAEIAEKLKRLEGWHQEGDAISKLYRFKEFMDSISFVNRIAEVAESMDHHPDILINYTRVTFTCSTHGDGGLTEKDFKLASDIEREFKKQ